MQPPSEPACNVTYTKTVKTITMEPSGNVTKVEKTNYMIPCAEAPSLPPVGAPDTEFQPTVTRTMHTLPLSSSKSLYPGNQDGGDVGLPPDGAFPPGLFQVSTGDCSSDQLHNLC